MEHSSTINLLQYNYVVKIAINILKHVLFWVWVLTSNVLINVKTSTSQFMLPKMDWYRKL